MSKETVFLVELHVYCAKKKYILIDSFEGGKKKFQLNM